MSAVQWFGYVDHPASYTIADIMFDLKDARISGNNVLYARVTNPDPVVIPHLGHSMMTCDVYDCPARGEFLRQSIELVIEGTIDGWSCYQLAGNPMTFEMYGAQITLVGFVHHGKHERFDLVGVR